MIHTWLSHSSGCQHSPRPSLDTFPRCHKAIQHMAEAQWVTTSRSATGRLSPRAGRLSVSSRLLLETGSHCSPGGLELTVKSKLPLNSQSCFHVPRARMTGACHPNTFHSPLSKPVCPYQTLPRKFQQEFSPDLLPKHTFARHSHLYASWSPF